jgi:hypothetical protein
MLAGLSIGREADRLQRLGNAGEPGVMRKRLASLWF